MTINALNCNGIYHINSFRFPLLIRETFCHNKINIILKSHSNFKSEQIHRNFSVFFKWQSRQKLGLSLINNLFDKLLKLTNTKSFITKLTWFFIQFFFYFVVKNMHIFLCTCSFLAENLSNFVPEIETPPILPYFTPTS